MRAGHFDRMGVERRGLGSRVSPRRLPFEGDGGRLYFGGNLSVEKGKYSCTHRDSDRNYVQIFFFLENSYRSLL